MDDNDKTQNTESECQSHRLQMIMTDYEADSDHDEVSRLIEQEHVPLRHADSLSHHTVHTQIRAQIHSNLQLRPSTSNSPALRQWTQSGQSGRQSTLSPPETPSFAVFQSKTPKSSNNSKLSVVVTPS